MREVRIVSWITAAALLGALWIAPGPASAGGGTAGDWELGGFGGYGWLDDYGTFHPKDDLLYGVRLGYFFTSHWSAELSGQRLPTETESEIPGFVDTDMENDAVRLNLMYNFGPGVALRPFLTAGGGWYRTDIEGIGDSKDLGWNAGGGLRLFLTPSWSLRADGRYSSVEPNDLVDETQNNVEATVGLSVLFGGKHEETPAAPENQPPTVSCVAQQGEVHAGETVAIVATASDPEGDPLTYEWTTSSGRVTGMGANATLDFTGATAPAAATVTVRVADDHGNVATCDQSVNMVAAVEARPAESVSCLAGGFPRNLSRLTNVDKACLDDVVQRLKADPRGRVVVIGHADGQERSPQSLAEQRAGAVRDYLTQAGIEAQRITIRSAGATKPLDTGTEAMARAQNRRVEVWYVPEGAREPE